MPVYEYKCSECGHIEQPFFAIDDPEKDEWDNGERFHLHQHDDMSPYAGSAGVMRRVFSFSSPADPIGDGYFDNSAGKWITNRRQLDDHNKAQSEAHTARTGVETNFVSHDIRDAATWLKPDPSE